MVANEFFLAALDGYTGKFHLNRRALDLGLAAGLLLEMRQLRLVEIRGTSVWAISPQPPRDQLYFDMFDAIRRERQPLRTWLAFFATAAFDAVAERMAVAGIIAWAPARRRLFGTTMAWLPVDRARAAGSWAALCTSIRQGTELPNFDMVLLAGLVHATDLHTAILEGSGPGAFDNLQRVLHRLPPPVRDLCAELRAVIDSSLMGFR